MSELPSPNEGLVHIGFAKILRSNVAGFQKKLALRIISRSYRNDTIRTHIIQNTKNFCITCILKKQCYQCKEQDKQHKLKNPLDLLKRCTLCGEDFSDDILHFFMNCCCAYQILSKYANILCDRLALRTELPAWAKTDWKIGAVSRVPTDLQRLLIFYNYPPKIRHSDKEITNQGINGLILLKNILHQQRLSNTFQPSTKLLLNILQEQSKTLDKLHNKASPFFIIRQLYEEENTAQEFGASIGVAYFERHAVNFGYHKTYIALTLLKSQLIRY